MTPNASPKTRFLESNDNVSTHRKMVDSREFQRASDHAMLQFSLAVCTGPVSPEEMSMGAAALKLRGAHDFLSIFRNLSEAPQRPSPILQVHNLDHKI